MKELIRKLSERISNAETRKRSRTAEEYQRFLYAIEYILTDIWKASYIHPEAECSIHKHNNYYSSNPRYRNSNLTYKMTVAAFDGLKLLNLMGLPKMVREIPEHPTIHLKPNLDGKIIILRDEIDGERVSVYYEEDAFTYKARDNLKTINHCFTRHWDNLCILDKDVLALQERLFDDMVFF